MSENLNQLSFDRILQIGEENRAQNARILMAIVSILCALTSFGLFALLASQPAWQLAILVILYAINTVVGLITLRYLYPRKKLFAGILGLSIFFGLTLIATSAALARLGFPAAIIYLIYSMIVSSNMENARRGNLLAGLGIILSGITALFSDFSPIPQLSIQFIDLVTPAILGILFMIYVVMLAMQSVTANLRTRLVSILLAIVLVPLSVLSIFQTQFLFNVLNDQTHQVLLVAAQQTARGFDEYFSSAQRVVSSAAKSKAFSSYLELPADRQSGSPEEQAVWLAMSVLEMDKIDDAGELSSYALLDLQGHNLYDSLLDLPATRLAPATLLSMGLDPEKIKNGERPVENGQDYFVIPATAGVLYLSPVQLPNSTRSFFYISAPVRNQKNQVIGVLRRRFDGNVLQKQLKIQNNLLGKNTYPILLDENNIRLADMFTPQYLYKAVAPLDPVEINILKSNQRLPDLPDSMLYTNYVEFHQILNNLDIQPNFTTEISTSYETNQLKEIGAVARLKTRPWKLVYLQTNYSDQALRSQQSKLTTFVTTLVACLIGLIAMGAAQALSSPIIRLTRTAQQISEGDLDAQAPAHSADEFGTLGRAFNSMTSQLRALINQLEERVHLRTQEIEAQNTKLSHRARQLETVSEVARQIVSSQELEPLLLSITQLISERFNFYHVGIFLLDQNKENAVLRAANSAGGQKMLARRHMLRVGKVGIVGYVTGTGQARIATDVGTDAVFFNNPDLPNTRSEMALPLKMGNTIIGALDIQSTEPNAFHTEDIELFNTLTDQVAIAIYNNQLFVETLKALDEAQKLHRQYLQSEWAKDTAH